MNGGRKERPPTLGSERESLRQAVRQAVGWVEKRSGAGSRQPRVPVKTIAKRLGVEVQEDAELPVRARWQVRGLGDRPDQATLWPGGERREVHRIYLHPGQSESSQRFAIAHELGHVVLHQRYPDLRKQIPDAEQERFANSFARELLVPASNRAQISAHFERADSPVTLLELADRLGVSVVTLLIVASEQDWFADLDRIWLDFRYGRNTRTGRDPRLRLRRAYLDGGRFYIPENRTEEGLFGEGGWLAGLGSGESRRAARLSLSRLCMGSSRRYNPQVVAAELRGVRLFASRWEEGDRILVGAFLGTDPGGLRVFASHRDAV